MFYQIYSYCLYPLYCKHLKLAISFRRKLQTEFNFYLLVSIHDPEYSSKNSELGNEISKDYFFLLKATCLRAIYGRT